jgi:hypothetical protein
MSRQEGDVTFDSDVGKIQANPETGVALFDMGVSACGVWKLHVALSNDRNFEYLGRRCKETY